jgi:hypothetical protein
MQGDGVNPDRSHSPASCPPRSGPGFYQACFSFAAKILFNWEEHAVSPDGGALSIDS